MGFGDSLSFECLEPNDSIATKMFPHLPGFVLDVTDVDRNVGSS